MLAVLPGRGLAQRSCSVVLGGQLHATQARFADHRAVSPRLGLTPSLQRGVQVGVALGLSARQEVQATVGFTAFGVAFSTKQHDAQTRFNGANVAVYQQNALEYALVLRRRFPSARQPGQSWFTDLGVDVEDMSLARPGGLFGFSNVDRRQPTGPGLEAEASLDVFNRYRVGLRLGGGREWALDANRRHYLALQLLGSFGLRDLQQFQLNTVVWQQSPAIDPEYYVNRVATRFSFVGVQLRYRYQL
jgi:hypothetical protein